MMTKEYREGQDAGWEILICGRWSPCPYAEGTPEKVEWIRGYDDYMRAALERKK